MNSKKSFKRPIFPFTAIIGQEEMKLALLLNMIDPEISYVIIMCDHGTGKSAKTRVIRYLLPTIVVVKDDPLILILIIMD